MRRLLPLAATFFALAAGPASARDAGTITCLTNLGPNGSALEVTLSAEAGGCPGPGEAIPAQWLISQRPVGEAAGRVAGASAVKIVTPADRVAAAAPAPAPAAAAPAAPAPAAPATASASTGVAAPSAASGEAAISKAVAAASAAQARLAPGVVVSARPVTAVASDSTAPPMLGGAGSGWMLLLLAAVAGGVALLARTARPARATA
jgi:2-oxoglutarate dehydrogenase E2 component (dihydrolipoamide succinyltransferase)